MDRGQKETNKILKDIEERINAEYSLAVTEIEEKLNDYFARFKKKDETWQRWVAEGSRTEKEYEEWKVGQFAVGKRWSDQKDVIAHDLANANEIAKAITRSEVADIYARNYNYATYEIEKDAHIDTSFTQYSKESVNRLMADNPDVLPAPGKKVSKEIAEGKAVRWNKQQLQSVMIQGILQGESIPKLATRLANTVGDKNRKAAIRNARTMATGAQNAGRVAAYKRAESKGVELEQMWLATMDNRTRHSHRWLDREVRPVGEAFSNGCEYPGDPKGDPAEIYNCRCSLRGVVKGLDRRSGQFRDDSKIDGMSYDEWRDAKPVSQDIQHQEKVGKAIKQKEINKYRGNNGIMTSTKDASEKSREYSREVSGGFSNSVDLDYINSNEYRMKFHGITGNHVVDDKIAEISKDILKDRNGTNQETLVLIDKSTGAELLRIADTKSASGIDYKDSDKHKIEKARKEGKEILAIHNHPNGLPPTADDCVSAFDKGYSLGVACGHNGTIRTYEPAKVRLSNQDCEDIHNAISLQCEYERDIDKRLELWKDILAENGCIISEERK